MDNPSQFLMTKSKTRHTYLSHLSWGKVLGFFIALTVLYYLLLGPHLTILSLKILFQWVEHLHTKTQLLAISLIPIYFALLIFGGGALGAFIGYWIQQQLKKVYLR